MGNGTITERTRALAERSANCVVCRRARRQQAGFTFWLVQTFEGLCPFCRAYEKVYGRKSHEPIPPTPTTGPKAHPDAVSGGVAGSGATSEPKG